MYLAIALMFAYLGSGVFAGEQLIVNGTDVTEDGKWPWQCSMRYGGEHSCGCVLIHENWVLTAGHCFTRAPNASFEFLTLTFGSNNRTDDTYEYEPTYTLRHEDYKDENTTGFTPNDIGLIYFEEGIELNDNIQPARLAPEEDRTSQTCYITGWGRTCGICGIPEILQEGEIPVIPDDDCSDLYDTDFNSDVHICVNGNSRGACSGDSGGPLVCQATDDQQWDLVGVTSFGVVGCPTAFPSVYTRVASFCDWIAKNTGNDVTC